MINNRQGGRRRGRGGTPRSLGSGSSGNRQDNRQRGNAAQLLEKYKALARDAQMAGDRVQAEYYLQFAEHYFRVLGESRARFEDQRRTRDDYSNDEGEDQDDNGSDEREESEEPPQRRRRETRSEPREERSEPAQREPRESRPRRQPRPRKETEEGSGDSERISADSLPPAIAIVEKDEDAPKPRTRRARRPREDGDEIAPAA